MSRPLTSRVLLKIIALVAGVGTVAWSLAWVCTRTLGREFIDGGPNPPIPFYFSTLMLFATSVLLQLSVSDIRRERQAMFRRRLWQTLLTVTLFLGSQSYGLWGIVQRNQPNEAATGAEPFVVVFATLHCAHVTIALLVLIHVVAQASENRYDHEYYLGPLVCALFWHALGWVWLCILGASVIAL